VICQVAKAEVRVALTVALAVVWAVLAAEWVAVEVASAEAAQVEAASAEAVAQVAEASAEAVASAEVGEDNSPLFLFEEGEVYATVHAHVCEAWMV